MTPSGHDEKSNLPPAEPAAPPADDDAILITDLAPRREVKGGSTKLLFGEEPLGQPQQRNER